MKKLNKFLSSGWNLLYLMITGSAAVMIIRMINNPNTYGSIFTRWDFYVRVLIILSFIIHLLSKLFSDEDNKE
jgi:hypothetical protein